MIRNSQSSSLGRTSVCVSSRDSTPIRPQFHAPFAPSSSHFRLIALSALGNKPIDPVHRRVFLPQWKFCEQYELLFRMRTLPFNTEDIAFTLQHLLEKVNCRTNVKFTRLFTQTGRELRKLADLPDFHSKVVLGTEDDQPPERGPPRREVHHLTSSASLPRLKVLRKRVASRMRTSAPLIELTLLPRRLSPPSKPHSHRTSPKSRPKTPLNHEELMDEITLIGSTLRPALQSRCRSKCKSTMTQEPTEESPLETPRSLAGLFSPQQIESLRKEYTRLRHLSFVEKVNEAVKLSPRLPGHVRNYLKDVKSKALDKCKDVEVFAMYLRDCVPVLKGKPQNVLKAVLRGLGSSGEMLSWSQWLLLNSLLVYDTAVETTKVRFVCRLLQTQNNYMDLLVLLTSMFQGEDRNSQFQLVFSQLKSISGPSSFFALQKMCTAGEVDYQLLIDALKSPS